MATKPLVEFPLEAGRNLVEKLEQNGLVLSAAYWKYQEDTDEWLLVLASPDVPVKGPRYVVELVQSALDSLTGDERDGLSLRNLVVDSPRLREIEGFGRRYGTIQSDSKDYWQAFRRSEPYIYRLLPA